MRRQADVVKLINTQSIMFASYALILTLFRTVTIASGSIAEENTTNTYFDQCKDSHKSTSCADTDAGPGMRSCRIKDDAHFYCTSTSPIQVAIGHVDSSRQQTYSKTINITSTASARNGHYSYCIEIAAETSANYSVQCRTNGSNLTEAKWIPFNPKNWRFGNTPIAYVNVTMADSKTFCNSTELDQVPLSLPCDTWHMCAILLANRQTYKKYVTVKLVDLSRMLHVTPSSCPNVRTLFSILQNSRTQKYDKPGLLAFQYQQHSQFLLPYNPSSPPSKQISYAEAFVTFKLKCNRDRDEIFIECRSSVLHSCGLQIVTKHFRIKNSTEDCHMHLMTVEHVPGFNGTITCSAFNEFTSTWDSKTEYFLNDNPSTLNGTSLIETPNHGANNINISNENKPTESPNYAGQTLTPRLQNTDTTPQVDGAQDRESPSLVLIIVGAVLGGIFLCLLILLPLLIYFYKRINLERRRIRLTQEEICEFIEGMQLEKAKSKGIHNVFVLPYDRSLEVSKIAVDFKTTILGSGAFGKVLKGTYKGQDVAIKTIDGTTLNADAFRSLLSELKIMSYLGKHEHVMELIGAITSDIKTGEVFLILEYCAHGSAVRYIREHRGDFVSFLSEDQATYIKTSCVMMNDSSAGLNSEHLVRWSYEIACGMEYVSSRNIYHGDLAARNILLTENLTVKVGDFGLSRQLDVEKYSCYVQKKECPLPLKWMAIESLRDLKFSIQSDVWSFGVTLWEFFSLGTIPYPGMEWNMESWKSLCEGIRLDRPEFASMRIYNSIMRKCWDEDPKDRPPFSALKTLLKVELEGFNAVETSEVTTLLNKYEKSQRVRLQTTF